MKRWASRRSCSRGKAPRKLSCNRTGAREKAARNTQAAAHVIGSLIVLLRQAGEDRGQLLLLRDEQACDPASEVANVAD